MTKTLAVEWGPFNGIRVNCVAPGTIVSSGMKNYPENVVDMIAGNDWMVSQCQETLSALLNSPLAQC